MKIREIRKEEYDQCQQMIYDIFDKCLAKEYSAKGRETFRNIIRFEDKTTWVAEDNNKIIGVSAIIKNTRHMMYLFILPQYQGKKIGTLLLDKVKKYLGPGPITVKASRIADKFYLKHGFKPTDEWQEEGELYYLPMKLDI